MTSKHIINDETIAMMKKGVTLINTSRGGLIDTKAVMKALKAGQIAYLGIDVYEQEEKLFFRDLSSDIIQDDLDPAVDELSPMCSLPPTRHFSLKTP